MSAIPDVRVPDIGDFEDIPIIEILVKPGDVIKPDDPLVTLESDKAVMDVPSAAGGTVKELKVQVGDRVSAGSLILTLEPSGPANVSPSVAHVLQDERTTPVVAVADAAQSPSPGNASAAPATAGPPLTGENSRIARTPYAGPAVRRMARELGVDLARVGGTGPKGRIMREDIESFVKTELHGPEPGEASNRLHLPPWPRIDFERFGPIERQPLSRLKKTSGPNLARNWVTIPHVTNFDEADVTELEAFRAELNEENAKSGPKVTMLTFLIKACVAALGKHPELNSSLDGDQLVLKRHFHIGFAADTPQGLVVPVVRDADRKGLLEIAGEVARLAAAARDGKLKPEETQGGGFSISSLGGIGGTGFTPIINAPEVAILGAAKAQMKPIWDGAQFAPRLMLPICVSWDHRAIDGAAAGRFLAHVAALLADFRRVSL